jgi:hypothetical protein
MKGSYPMKKYLNSYSIMMPFTDHIDEICQDIKEQYESGVATCVLFEMTLVPEGNPPADKVSKMCRQYRKVQEKLNAASQEIVKAISNNVK